MSTKIFIGHPKPKSLLREPTDLVTIQHKNQSYLGSYFSCEWMSLKEIEQAITLITSKVQDITFSPILDHRAIILLDFFFGDL